MVKPNWTKSSWNAKIYAKSDRKPSKTTRNYLWLRWDHIFVPQSRVNWCEPIELKGFSGKINFIIMCEHQGRYQRCANWTLDLKNHVLNEHHIDELINASATITGKSNWSLYSYWFLRICSFLWLAQFEKHSIITCFS